MTVIRKIIRMLTEAFTLCAAAVLLPAGVLSAQGLGFHGMDHRIDRRTSWNVFGDRPEVFDGEIRLEFELYTRPSSEFGYFFRLKDEGGSRRIWNLSYDSRGDSITVRLNEEGRQSLIKAAIAHDSMKHLHWNRVGIAFDLKRDSVRLDIAGKSFRTHFPGLPDRIRAAVVFGRSDHIIDVPSFAVRELRIGGGGRNFYFPLDFTEGNVVCDSRFRVEGRVENPEWLINDAMRWKELAGFSYLDIAGACYNSVRKEFCYFTDKEMTVLDLMRDRAERHFFSSPCPVVMKLGNNVVSEDGDSILCYELHDDEAPAGSPSAARLDLDSRGWRTVSTDRLKMPMHHHCGFINPADGRYVILGGFGNMLYNGDFYEFDEDSGHWNEIWHNHGGDVIQPRYFTSAGTDGESVYIYGGMGNECGEQVVGRRYFYDLHRIDPETGFCELLWTQEDGDRTAGRKDGGGTAGREDGDKVPVRNLIVDGDFFYTLRYPEYIGQSELYLYRISIADGTAERLCNSIPIVSDKMRTNANIYLDRNLGCFFATVQEFDDDIKSTLKIYSLAYPPVTENSGISDARRRFRVFLARYGLLSGIAAAVMLAAGYALSRILRKRKRGGPVTGGPANRRIFRKERSDDSISLFGGFTVIGHDGTDITSGFTNQQILILCLLIKRGENGMSGKRLSSILWPDKEEDKVKNSRGVAINNLRRSLSRLEGAAVTYRGGRYYLELTAPCTCDWFELDTALKEKNLDRDRILGIISGGKFLKSIGDEIFDDFKEKAENIVFPLLHEELEARFKAKEYEAVCEIGEMIAKIDPTDETALRTVIRAMRRQKRTEEALVVYAAFCAEYKKANDADFGVPFKEL